METQKGCTDRDNIYNITDYRKKEKQNNKPCASMTSKAFSSYS